MSIPSNCCEPCPSVQSVNVPGIQGNPGADGTNGVNGIDAFTITTADFVVPAIGANVGGVSVGIASWMVPGQNVFVQGPDNFEVVSVDSLTTCTLKFLGYTGDVSPGATISTGAGVSPGGLQGVPAAVPAATGDFAVGGSQALTGTPGQLLSKTVTLTNAGEYILLARLRIDYNGATFAANQIATLKLRRTNNTPGDLTDAIANMELAVVTTETSTAGELTILAVPYTAGAGDIIEPWGSVDVIPSVGTLDAVEASITAVQLS